MAEPKPSLEDLQGHWDGCAGAEATINDWRQRAEKAVERVLALEAKCDLLSASLKQVDGRAEKAEREYGEQLSLKMLAVRDKEQAEARLAELTSRMREWAADTDEAPRSKHWGVFDRLLTEFESLEPAKREPCPVCGRLTGGCCTTKREDDHG